MKGIVLAGGTGSRLFPLSKVTNKHLLPVGYYPMIYYSLGMLNEAGISSVLVITGTEHMGHMVNLLGSGKQFNMDITYKVQDQAGGIAEALQLAQNFAHNDKMVVLLGDNIFEDKLQPYVDAYQNSAQDAFVLLKSVPDPFRFGVATVNDDGQITKIIEKPKKPQTDLAVTGLYFYEPSVFDFIETLAPSDRGELEITDVNNWYVERGQMGSAILNGFWTDAGTHDSWRRAQGLADRLKDRIANSLSLEPIR